MMNVKPEKKSDTRLKEMLKNNSRYGSVDIVVNEVLAIFYTSGKEGFSLICEDTFPRVYHL